MSDSIDQLCEKCGHTFSAFLHEMAEQNEKVVCPNCRGNGDCRPAKTTESTKIGETPARKN
jgi:hypothetical protein